MGKSYKKQSGSLGHAESYTHSYSHAYRIRTRNEKKNLCKMKCFWNIFARFNGIENIRDRLSGYTLVNWRWNALSSWWIKSRPKQSNWKGSLMCEKLLFVCSVRRALDLICLNGNRALIHLSTHTHTRSYTHKTHLFLVFFTFSVTTVFSTGRT